MNLNVVFKYSLLVSGIFFCSCLKDNKILLFRRISQKCGKDMSRSLTPVFSALDCKWVCYKYPPCFGFIYDEEKSICTSILDQRLQNCTIEAGRKDSDAYVWVSTYLPSLFSFMFFCDIKDIKN